MFRAPFVLEEFLSVNGLCEPAGAFDFLAEVQDTRNSLTDPDIVAANRLKATFHWNKQHCYRPATS